MTDLEKRLRAIDQLLEQWRARLTFLGVGGLVAQIRALLSDLVREVEALKKASDLDREAISALLRDEVTKASYDEYECQRR